MNCQDISKQIYQYCDGEVTPEEKANISQHLDYCTYCQHLYQLTMLENDVLRDKNDIPDLSPGFTSLVMKSLQSDKGQNNQSRYSRLNRKVWLSGLTTVAAVFVLLMYMPHLSFSGKNISLTYNNSIQEQSSPSPSVASDSLTGAGASNITDSSNPIVSKDTSPVVPPNIVKPVPVTDDSQNPSLFLAATESSAAIKPNAALESSRSIYYDRAANDSTMSLRPQNIPERLKFVQVNNVDNKTVFDYASLDGKECLQLTLIPYSEPIIASKTKTNSLPQDPLVISKDIQIADKKMTVIISGNLPREEMTNLANAIQFKDISSN